MATEFVEEISDEASPKDLRDRLAEVAKQNRQLVEENSTYKARDFLAEKGFDLVEAADLKGVAADQLEAKATEIQKGRVELQEKLLRAALSKQGIEGDDLDQLVAQAVGRQAEDDGTADAARRIRQVGQAKGDVVPRVNPDNLHGFDAMSAYFEQASKRK